MAVTPTEPVSSPASRAGRGTRRNNAVDRSAAKIGIAPLSMPVSAEFTHCWATGKIVNGTATQTNDSTTTRSRSSGCSGRRAAGTSQSVAPPATRRKVIRPGRNASRAMSMSRNDAPQIVDIEQNSAQSVAVKAPGLCSPQW